MAVEGDAAELYERYVAHYILSPWARALADLADVREGERVLDLACGTGVVARLAAERAGSTGHVTGLDLNAGMIAVARSLPPPAGARIDWIERSALDTALPDGSIDVILCQQGLQFFPDKVAALREMRRVLAHGGRIALSVWRSTGIYNTAVGNALREHLGDEIATRFCASRKAPDENALVQMALDAGFADVKLQVQSLTARLPPPEEFVPGHLAATPIAANVRAAASEVRAAVSARVARELAHYVEGSGIAFPEEVNVLTARK